MADVHRRLAQAGVLKNLEIHDFSRQAGHTMADVNDVHPFREGSGRTQMAYLKQLALEAGHPPNFARIGPKRWIAASQSAHAGDDRPMADEIFRAAQPG